MTNKDIYRNLGGIDPELIVEASKKRGNNGYGRVVKWASLAACIAIIVTAIPVTLILNREEPKAPAVTTPVEDIVVTPGGENEENKSLNVIYCDSLMIKKEGLIQNAFNDKNVEIKSSDEFCGYRQYYESKGEILEPDISVPAELNFTVGGTTINATLKSYYYTKGSENITDETLKENNKIAEYAITKVNGSSEMINPDFAKVYYSVEAKAIVGLNTYVAVDDYTEKKVTQEELLEIAKKDVTALYGEDFLSKYSVRINEIYSEPAGVSYSGGWTYYVIFERVISGFEEYDIDEDVTLSYNGLGELYCIYSHDLNSFNNVESKLTESVRKDSEERATKLLDGRLATHKAMTMNCNGEVYTYCIYDLREEETNNYKFEGSFRIKLNLG